MPTFYLNSSLVHFGVHQTTLDLPNSSGIEAFKEEISACQWSKGGAVPR
jgi:uncharacterized protein YdhG (YjbR/CyaY superfamily)